MRQISYQVRDQVWDQVWVQVWEQVGGQVWNQIRGQVRAPVRDLWRKPKFQPQKRLEDLYPDILYKAHEAFGTPLGSEDSSISYTIMWRVYLEAAGGQHDLS